MGALNLGRVRGTMWYSGVGISGTSTTGVVFPGSGVTAAYEGDMFLNTSTGEDAGNVYRCVVEGDPQVAEWVYAGALKVQTELVNNLDSTSVTKGLAANQGRVLKEMIENSGIIPLDVLPKCNETAYNAQLVVKNEAATITVKTYDGEAGTYTVTPGGTGSTKTVTFTIGAEIGLQATGAAIREISSTVPIYTYALFDNDNQQIAGGDLDLWSRVNEAEENVQEGAAITDGTEEDPGETVKRGLLSKIINGIRTKLWPVTHAKAVWYNESEDTTVWDEFGNVAAMIAANAPMRGSLPENTDLNTVTVCGTYWLVPNTTYVNMPPGVESGLLCVLRSAPDDGAMNQVVFTNRVFYRGKAISDIWSAWRLIYSVRSALTLTYTENSYVDQSRFNRLRMYEQSGVYYFYGNLELSAALPSGQTVEIGRINDYNGYMDVYICVPSQAGNGAIAVFIRTNGSIEIATNQSSAPKAFYRFQTCVPKIER